MISSDMEEVIGVSDRMAVMHEGQISGFTRAQSVQRAQCAAAGGRQSPCIEIDQGKMTTMLKKDLGLFILILVVGTVVAILNPRFISPINIATRPT